MKRHSVAASRHTTILKILAICIIGGLIISLLPVFLEYTALSLQKLPLNSRAFLLGVYPPYAFLTTAAGAALGLLLSGMHIAGVFSGKARSTIQIVLSVLITGCTFVVVVMHINVQFLPVMKDIRSILGNIALLLAFAGFGYSLYRFWGVVLSRVSPWLSGGAVAVILIIGGLIMYRAPIGATGKIPERVRGKVKGPDVVLATIDTLRADHLSCFGYSRNTSPFMDKLARRGVLFTNYIAASSWTRPSVASLLTSLYPSGHKVKGMNSRLPEPALSLAEVMKDAGYVTSIFTANGHVSRLFGFEQGVDYFYQTKWRTMIEPTGLYHLVMSFIKPLAGWLNKLEWTRIGGRELEDDLCVLNEFIKWHDSLEGKPFFAYIHFNAPHDPYNPPSPYSEMFTESSEKLDFKLNILHRVGECDEKWPEPVQKKQVALYDGEIAYADNIIRKLIETVYTEERPRDLLFILVSDHGEGFYEHCRYGHGNSLYHELLHVPGIIYYPGKIPAGRKVDYPVSTVDIAPTILSLAGLPPQAGFMGRNLAPYLLKNNPKPAPQAYSELFSSVQEFYAVTDREKNKLIQTEKEEKTGYELYDLKADPGEKKNLLLDEDYRAIKTSLKKKLLQLKELAAMSALDKEEVELDETTRERLKALGYVQ